MTQKNSIIPKHEGKFKSILIFGPPGSGKGTMGSLLGTASSEYHLSSGDIFRSLAPESPAGQLYHQYASKGLLLPDAVTIEIWNYYVNGLIATNKYFPAQQSLLLDGIPRTKNQAEILDDYITVQQIIVLEVKNEKELFRRIRRRAKIEGRKDDMDEEVLKTRMQVYMNETAQVLDHYPEELISRFNAEQKPLEVFRDILVDLCDVLCNKQAEPQT